MIKNEHIYFIGIGGIGMSALARYFKARGYAVSGYDLTETPLTRELSAEGIDVHYVEDIECIPQNPYMVVYTPAIPHDNKELVYCISNNYKLFKRAEVLGVISKEHRTIACAGTHGKTTISTFVAHIFNTSEKGCMALLGGISKNYNSNVILSDRQEILVTEADEYDRSFLKLSPEFAIISSVNADHLDIYSDAQDLINTYSEFANKIKDNGILLYKFDSKLNIKELSNRGIKTFTYSLSEKSDFYAENIVLANGYYNFDFITNDQKRIPVQLGVPGLYNVENAVAALGIAYLAGVSVSELQESAKTFKGVARRFDVKYKDENHIYIDDYAHHPEEIAACIESAQKMFPNREITVVFQPHLYTRTRDFMDEFAESLSKCDTVVLMPIYPARELPIEGITSEAILEKIDIKNKYHSTKPELIEKISELNPKLLITMGAGDISNFVNQITDYFNNKFGKK